MELHFKRIKTEEIPQLKEYIEGILDLSLLKTKFPIQYLFPNSVQKVKILKTFTSG